MIHIHVTSTSRGEGKTLVAVRLMEALPNAVLVVRNAAEHTRVTQGFHVSARRVLWRKVDLLQQVHALHANTLIWDDCDCKEL